jgi:DNA-binding transcriptional regulator YiaG
MAANGIGITAAQDLCAGWLHTSRRAWQQWESGDRRMHPAFWDLLIRALRDAGIAPPV